MSTATVAVDPFASLLLAPQDDPTLNPLATFTSQLQPTSILHTQTNSNLDVVVSPPAPQQTDDDPYAAFTTTTNNASTDNTSTKHSSKSERRAQRESDLLQTQTEGTRSERLSSASSFSLSASSSFSSTASSNASSSQPRNERQTRARSSSGRKEGKAQADHTSSGEDSSSGSSSESEREHSPSPVRHTKRAEKKSKSNRKSARDADIAEAQHRSGLKLTHDAASPSFTSTARPPRSPVSPPAVAQHVIDISSRSNDPRMCISSSKIINASSYNTFGGSNAASSSSQPLSVALTTDLSGWLRFHSFDTTVERKLLTSDLFHSQVGESSRVQSVTPASLVKATKAQLKEVLGVRDGIRMYQRLREVEAVVKASAAQQQQQQNRPSLRNGSILDLNHPPLQPSTCSTADSHQPGLYGHCCHLDCSLPARSHCATKGCERGLCIAHSSKSLLSGTVVCESCYEKLTYTEDIRIALGITALEEQGYNVPQCVVQ